MCALDWNGKLQRELNRGLATQQSPDGSRLLAVGYPIVNAAPAVYVAVDDHGQLLDRVSKIWQDEARWADDNRHLCYIEDSNPTGQGGVAYLDEQQPGAPSRRVATVGGISYYPPAPANGGPAPAPLIGGPHLLACSTSADRAVILNPAKGVITVVRLSDGAELLAHQFGHLFYPFANSLGSEQLIASSDGHYLAENIEGAHDVPIVDLVSDTVVVRLPALMVAGFSSDGTRAVTRLNDQVVGVIEWRSKRVVRQLAGTYAYARPRPESADLLVGVPSTRHQFGLDLYIVRGDGASVEVARSVQVIGQ